jgi:hypothetical protein
MFIENLKGGYAYIPALPFASAGVVALAGMSFARAVFAEPLRCALDSRPSSATSGAYIDR